MSFQIVRHTSECDTVDVGPAVEDRETALTVMAVLIRHNRAADLDIIDTETGRYVSWVMS